ARNFQIRGKRGKHRVESLARNGGLKERDIEKMFDAAMAIERQARAGDSIQRGGCNVFDRLPCRVAAVECRFSDAPIRIIRERAALRYRQTLAPAIRENHFKLQL